MQISFSSSGAGSQTSVYRDEALAAAIAVHDQLWSERKITRSMTEREKALVYYEWICANATYDDNANETSLSHLPYQLFKRGLAVCDGYTGAYNLLLKLEGIACSALYNDDHIWTVADLDGEFVHIDTTWGDTNDNAIDYTYFAMTPQESYAEHPW
jgi:transglutaminase/protease-like cytokinesis protein 3